MSFKGDFDEKISFPPLALHFSIFSFFRLHRGGKIIFSFRVLCLNALPMPPKWVLLFGGRQRLLIIFVDANNYRLELDLLGRPKDGLLFLILTRWAGRWREENSR